MPRRPPEPVHPLVVLMTLRSAHGHFHARESLFQHLTPSEIYNLRLAHSSLACTILGIMSFHTLRINFTHRSLCAPKLAALARAPFIARQCTRLIFNFAHTYETEILPRERAPGRVHPTFYLIPREGRLDRDFVDYTLAEVPLPCYGPLYEAARDVTAFRNVFENLIALEATSIRTPGAPAVLRGHAVDEAVLSVRAALDECRTDRMGYLEFKGHAGGVLMLTPGINWSGGGRGHGGWWVYVRRFELELYTETWDCLHEWEKEAVAEAVRGILNAMAPGLRRLTFGFVGERVDDFAWPPEVEALGRLTELTLRGLYVGARELVEWLDGPAKKVMAVVLATNVWLGEDARCFYDEWDIEDGHVRGRKEYRHCRKLRIQNPVPERGAQRRVRLPVWSEIEHR